MSRAIQVGDLVMVVRACCSKETLGLALGLAEDDSYFAEQRGADEITARASAAIAKALGK